MATFGLTSLGFFRPTLAEIRDAINTDLQNVFGTSIDLDTGILARFVGILAERYNSLWDALEAVYASQNRNTASGFALDALGELIGATRIEAIFSTVTLTLTGTPAQIVPAAQQVSTKSNGGANKFLTATSGTIIALTAWAATTYSVGQRITNAGKAYQVLTGGAASAPGPTFGTTGQTSTGTDGGGVVQYLYLGDGTGAVDVSGQSLLKGAIVGVARDIIQIDQPIGGWTGVINVLDASLGFDDQTDESFRLTQEEELAASGASTADAIRSAVLRVKGVTSCTVFVNETDVTDGNGLPPHSVLVLVRGGDNAAIGAVLLAQIAAGIATTGTITTNPIDSEGVAHAIKFSRPAEINIGVKVTIVKDPTTYPSDGDAQVALAIVTSGNAPGGEARKAGVNARASAVGSAVFQVPGVLEVTSTLLSSTPAPGTPATPTLSTSIAISLLQLAVFDTAWTTVISSDDVP